MGRYVRPRPARLKEKLLFIRMTLGLSQNGMLERLGLGESLLRTTISSYERGASEPPLPILLQYARLAGVCLDFIVDDELDLPQRLPARSAKHVVVSRRVRASRRK